MYIQKHIRRRKMRKKIEDLFIKGLATISLCLSLGYLISAQNNGTVVAGSVLDPAGAVIPGAIVTLIGQGEGGITKRQTTNDEGRFTFPGVVPGDYELEVTTSIITRSLRKRITVKSGGSPPISLTFPLEPCFGEEESETRIRLTDEDRAEITREIINLRFPNLHTRAEKELPKIIFSDVNIQPNWLSQEQVSKISILPRGKIQDITDQTGGFTYYSISPLTRRGSCISLSLNENVTVKGQEEDANMAGGGTFYEFRKVNGKWTGKVFSSWIS
jgi:hypothetical protein